MSNAKTVAEVTETLVRVWLLGWEACKNADAGESPKDAWALAEWEVKKVAAPVILAATGSAA